MTRPDEPLAEVSRTALGTAALRAHESRRADRLFDDPYAEAFDDTALGVSSPLDGPDGSSAGRRELSPMEQEFYGPIVTRTRFFDDYLTRAAGGCAQVVLLAAGLDTRAFRLTWPAGTRMFELDFPGVLAFKDTVLGSAGAVPRCQRTTVPCDLRTDWAAALTATGFDPAVPTAWLAEGIVIYLSPTEADQLFSRVTGLSAPGSQLSFEHTPAGSWTGTSTGELAQTPAMRELASLWQGGLADEAPGWLSGHGWRHQLHDVTAFAATLQRPELDPGPFDYLTAIRG
ncbi:MAG TPA: SAM-dependent methyltransferase [Trebonia sp.]|jgi:methyltransferase (TIGR00027 family)